MLKIENPCFVVFFKYNVENSTLLYIGYFVFFNFFFTFELIPIGCGKR